jgi:hypothetical protein
MNKSIKTEIIINASKEKVWQVLTDFKSYPRWNPFIMVNRSKKFRFKPKVVSVVPFRYFDWLGNLFIKGLFDGHHYFEIEELMPHQVKLSHGEYFSGLLSASILKKIAEDTRNNFIRMNNALKQQAEAN